MPKHPDNYRDGLIDRLLDLRRAPAPQVLIMSNDGPRAWVMAIDAALQEVVPALKAISMLSTPTEHGANCIFGPEAKRIIGRVPITLAEKEGGVRWPF